MKCQHCGINFDESERECPMCGARAGSRGHLGETKEQVRNASSAPANARVTARRARASARPIRESKKKGRGRAVVVVILLVALLNFLPAIVKLASGVWNSMERWFTGQYDRESGETALCDQMGNDLLGTEEYAVFLPTE